MTKRWYSGPAKIANWEVSWIRHEQGTGIPKSELAAFKVFLRGVIPILPQAIEFSALMRKQITGSDNLNTSPEAPHPAVRFYSTHFGLDGVQYSLEVSWDGAVFVYRLKYDSPDPDGFIATLDLVPS